MRGLMRRPEIALFALMLGAYAYFYQAGGWNQNSRLDLVRGIVERGTSIIDAYHHNTGDKSCRGPGGECAGGRADARRGEHYYCDKAPGVSWLVVPVYAVAYAVWGDDRPSERYLATSAYAGAVVAVGLPSALAVVMLYVLLAVFPLSVAARLLLACAYGLATIAFPYATLLYGHQLSAALILVPLAVLARARHSRRSPGWAGLLAMGVSLGYAIVAEYPAALAVIPVCIYAVGALRTDADAGAGLRAIPWPRLAVLVGGMALAGAALAAYHWIVFGSPLALPYDFSTQPHRHHGFFMGIGVPDLDVLRHILLTGHRGLFYSAPWLALAAPGAYVLWRRGFRAEVILCAVVFVLFVWLNASLSGWHGGWTTGPRYLIPAIPFLVILAAGVFALPPPLPAWFYGRRRLRRAGAILVMVAMAYSALLMLASTAVKPEVPEHIRNQFTQYLLPRLFAGEVAINTQSIDRAAPTRGKRYAWNLGHAAGLDGPVTLVPLAGFALGLGFWLGWAARSSPAAINSAGTRHR